VADQGEAVPVELVRERDHVPGDLGEAVLARDVTGLAIASVVGERVGERVTVQVRLDLPEGVPVTEPAMQHHHPMGAGT
jgi:hypothetical protein